MSDLNEFTLIIKGDLQSSVAELVKHIHDFTHGISYMDYSAEFDETKVRMPLSKDLAKALYLWLHEPPDTAPYPPGTLLRSLLLRVKGANHVDV